MSPRPYIFIYDGRFEPARRQASLCHSRSIETLDTQQTDLGQAWTTFLRSQASAGTELVGMTRWMDSYISESFGLEFGLKIRRRAAQHLPQQDLFSWELSRLIAAQKT
jgi:hypothetical protein